MMFPIAQMLQNKFLWDMVGGLSFSSVFSAAANMVIPLFYDQRTSWHMGTLCHMIMVALSCRVCFLLHFLEHCSIYALSRTIKAFIYLKRTFMPVRFFLATSTSFIVALLVQVDGQMERRGVQELHILEGGYIMYALC